MVLTDVLIFSSLLFFIPLHKYYQKQNKNDFETLIAILLLMQVMTSLLHWSNPIRYTKYHTLDMFLTKILLIIIPVYFFFYKKDITDSTRYDMLVLLTMTLLFYKISNNHSSKFYQTYDHITNHVVFHILAVLGCILVLK
jgi:hypothetical protein